MTPSAGQLKRRRARRAAAAKLKRQRRLVIVLAIAFVAVAAIQVPRTLKMLDSGGEAAPAAPAPVAKAKASTPQRTSKELRFLLANRGVDPFAARAIADRDPRVALVGAPAGLRDPFSKIAASAPAATPAPVVKPKPVAPKPLPRRIVVGTRRNGQAKFVGYIVILASIPTTNGRASATLFADRARRNGVRGVGVLDSSTRNPLRPGYYVVYIGSFKTQAAARAAGSRMRAAGYRGAYLRELARY